MFPISRPRRLRQSETLRNMVRETDLKPADLIYPMFVIEGHDIKNPVQSMPGVEQLSLDRLLPEVEEVARRGIPSVLLFGIPAQKDSRASEAYNPKGIVQEAVRIIKQEFPQLVVVTDVCLCEYTDHGHCGVVEDGRILNDPTLDLLARTALSHAAAGADIVAPSDMMDGRVAAIRQKLDENGFADTVIMSYAVKYASAFYGPFRDAAGSAPQFGDRKTHQMDPANVREAIKEVELDLTEGADMVMVKPALSYLDVIQKVKESTQVPVACYNVSGEYAMVKAAARAGWIDERKVVLELLTSMKRAGADLILTYHAKDAADWL